MRVDHFNRVHFELNGVEFVAYQGSLEGVERLVSFGYIRLGESDLYLSGGVSRNDVLTGAGYRTFDWSKPQAWFDAYLAEHGKVPDGFWYYPPKPDPDWLYGRFVGFDEALEKLGQAVAELWKTFKEVENGTPYVNVDERYGERVPVTIEDYRKLNPEGKFEEWNEQIKELLSYKPYDVPIWVVVAIKEEALELPEAHYN
jgi:hypothetical protein